MKPLQIHTRDDLPRIIAMMQQAGAPQFPLLQAVYAGAVAYLPIYRTTTAHTVKEWIGQTKGPAVATIGDDDHAVKDGPGTWPVASRLLRWAQFVILHGAAGEPEHYQQAVVLANTFGRVLLIECASHNLEAWHTAAGGRAIAAHSLVIAPRSGPHPIMPNRGAMN
jgi:hypothetical protein